MQETGRLEKFKNIAKNPDIIWNIAGISANALYSMLLIIFVTRINGNEQSWGFSFAFYIASVFQTIGNYGGRIYQVSDIKKKYSDDTYVSLKVVTAAVMVGLALLFSLFNQYSLDKLLLMLILVGYRFFEDISEACFGVLQKNYRLDVIGKSMFFKAVASSGFFLLINYLTKNVSLASLSFVVIYAGTLILYDWKKAIFYSKMKLVFDKRILCLGKSSFQVFLYTFLNIFILNITRYFVDANINDTMRNSFTILVIPVSLMALFAQFLIQPIVTPLVEKYTKDVKAFIKDAFMILLALLGVGILVSGVSYFIMVDLLTLVYGVPLKEYRLESALLILAGICSGGTTIISMLMVIMRKLTGQTIAYIVSALVSIVVSQILVKESIALSLYAYMIGMFAQFLIFIILFVYYLKTERRQEDKEK